MHKRECEAQGHARARVAQELAKAREPVLKCIRDTDEAELKCMREMMYESKPNSIGSKIYYKHLRRKTKDSLEKTNLYQGAHPRSLQQLSVLHPQKTGFH
jgi:hypothetical protein